MFSIFNANTRDLSAIAKDNTAAIGQLIQSITLLNNQIIELKKRVKELEEKRCG